MQVLTIPQSEYAANVDLIMEMHRLRRRVFKDRLDWEVSVSGDMEMDTYDAFRPTYLVEVTEGGAVVGSVRLLPTTGPYMLANTFPALLEGRAPPRSPGMVESSRFCVDTAQTSETDGHGLRYATGCLFAGMIEWGLSRNVTAIVTVTDTRVERILRRAGWPLERMGIPRQIGKTHTLAGLLEVNEEALSRVRRNTGLVCPVLVRPVAATIAA